MLGMMINNCEQIVGEKTSCSVSRATPEWDLNVNGSMLIYCYQQ